MFSVSRFARTTATLTAAGAVSVGLAACGAPRVDNGGQSSGAAACDGSQGITDTTIKVGASGPQSGAAAAWWDEEKAAQAYFNDINDAGGITSADGKTRKIEYKPLEDGYDPARTLSNARELVGQDHVAFMMNVVGTANNQAINSYLEDNGVPNVFAGSGVLPSKDNNKYFLSGFASYKFEAYIFANYIIKNFPDAKVGIIYQAGTYGETIDSYMKDAFKGTGVSMVAEQSHQPDAANIDSQMVSLANSGANVWVNYANGTYSSQALHKAHQLGWKPDLVIQPSGNNSKSVVSAAGPELAGKLVTFHWLKDVSSPAAYRDEGTDKWEKFAKGHGFDPANSIPSVGYNNAYIVAEALKGLQGCTRDDVLDAVNAIKDVSSPVMLPGVAVTITPDYRFAYSQVGLLTWNGSGYDLGKIVTRGEGLGQGA